MFLLQYEFIMAGILEDNMQYIMLDVFHKQHKRSRGGWIINILAHI